MREKELVVDDAIERRLAEAGKLTPEAAVALAITANARREHFAAETKAATRPAARGRRMHPRRYVPDAIPIPARGLRGAPAPRARPAPSTGS